MKKDQQPQSPQQNQRNHWMTLFFGFVIVLVTVAVLRFMGRTWWCSCGTLIPWSWDINSSHNSQHLIDPYFFSHVLHGILFAGALHLIRFKGSNQAKLLIVIAAEACWEILENSSIIIERYRAATISLDYFGDSIANSFVDIVACLLGYWFASSLRWWWSLAIFAAVELILLATIRDCLVLNIIMLVSPLEAIKQWQMAA